MRAFLGMLISTIFFRSPFIGLLLSLFFYPHTQKGKGNTFTFHGFNGAHWQNFMHVNFSDKRWIEGCFSSLGAFARMRGHVREEDITYASKLMKDWQYSASERHNAIAAFTYGKNIDPSTLIHMLGSSGYWHNTSHSIHLLSILTSYLEAYPPTETQRKFFHMWSERLNRTQYTHNNYHYHHQQHHKTHQKSPSHDIQWACTMLGISESDSQQVVKRAFRKKMSQHHPDRNHKDPDATKKTQNIQKAYSVIKDAKGWS